MSERLFPPDYYDICLNNRKPKKHQWFCNRLLSPKTTTCPDISTTSIEDVNPEISVVPGTSAIQETTITSSDESAVIQEALSSPENTAVNPDYIPSTSTSTESSIASPVDFEKEDTSTFSGNDKIDRTEDLTFIDNLRVQERPSTVKDTVKSSNASRKRKEDFCYYCETLVSNFARHLYRNHRSELDVQKLSAYPLGSKKRNELLTLIRKKGNYLNNCEGGKPVREGIDSTTYLPCIHCLGFYSSKNLWRHRKECSENPNTGNSTAATKSAAQNFQISYLKVDPGLRENVFPRMRADKISLVAKKDFLICSFAARYMKIHREKHFISVVSRKMRELSRLLIQVTLIQPTIKTLFDALKPQHYDLLVTATKTVSKYDTVKEFYVSATYAINMGTSLKQCCDIALIYVLKKKDICATMSTAECEADLKTLTKLIENNWKFDISSQACTDLNAKKWNKVTIVPLASDLRLLKNYLIRKANEAVEVLKEDHKDERAYIILLETVFCRLVLLNRKRPGELQRFLLRTYEDSLKNENNNTYEEFSEVVSEGEKALIKNFKSILIRGKRGRGVPLLLSQYVQEHFHIILQHRPQIFKQNNVYLFGNPRSDQPIIGYKIMQRYANECGAKNPSAITCTRLRKHLATLTQLFNLSDNDIEQLATFMGHTVGIHKSSYRLPDDVYQIAKVSKLLLLMEKGNAGKFKGKSLDEIDLNLEEDLMEGIEEDRFDERIEQYLEDKDLESEDCLIPERRNVDENDETRHTEKEVGEKAVSIECQNQTTGNSKKGKRISIPWTEEQKKMTMSYFKEHIRLKKPPKRGECETLINQHPDVFRNKNWLKMKVFIQNKYSQTK